MNGTPQDRIERIYREHGAVQDIAVFGDELTPCVALVVSEVSERDLRSVLDEIASRSPECTRIVDFVALYPDDPLIFPLFIAGGEQRRDLIWEILFGCLEMLTFVPEPTYTPARQPTGFKTQDQHSHQGVD
jgi:hypothetical protein